jgi:hypothetical protein
MLAAIGNIKVAHLLDKDLWQALALPVAEEGELTAVREPSFDARSAQAPRAGGGLRRLPLVP